MQTLLWDLGSRDGHGDDGSIDEARASVKAVAAALRSHAPGQVAFVPVATLPLAMLVRVKPGEGADAYRFTEEDAYDRKVAENGSILVAIGQRRSDKGFRVFAHTENRLAEPDTLLGAVVTLELPVKLAFASTFRMLQGLSIKRLLLDVTSGKVKFEWLLDALALVRQRAHVRVMPPRPGVTSIDECDVAYLMGLHANENDVSQVCGYSPTTRKFHVEAACAARAALRCAVRDGLAGHVATSFAPAAAAAVIALEERASVAGGAGTARASADDDAEATARRAAAPAMQVAGAAGGAGGTSVVALLSQLALSHSYFSSPPDLFER